MSMETQRPGDPRDAAFLREAESARERIGRGPLTDDDLIILACEEISRTCTREELRYRT